MRSILLPFALCLLPFAIRPCAAGLTFSCRHDDRIDPNVRSAIHDLNQTLIKSMQDSRPAVLLDLLLDELRTEPNCVSEVEKAYAGFKPLVTGRTFKVFSECHIITTGADRYMLDVPSETKEKFTIHAFRLSPETCICFLTSQGYFFDYMVSVIYSKMPSGWRVQKIHIGLCRVAGMSPRQWYIRARQLYDRGETARAYCSIEIARVLLRPSPFMDYKIESEIADVYKKFSISFHSKLYQQLRRLPNSPRLYSFTAQFIQTELLPKILYVSSIPLDDANSLRKETARMTACLKSVYPDILGESSRVAWIAFREQPADPNKTYPSREFLLPLDPNAKDPNAKEPNQARVAATF